MLTLEHIAHMDVKWRKMANYLGARYGDIDDVVQTMYLRVAEIQTRDGNLNRIESPNGGVNTFYIFKIIQSEVINIYRAESKTIDHQPQFNPIDAPEEAEYKYQALMGRIKQVIDTMHEYDQMILELYFVYGHSLRQIEKRTGITVTSVYNTLKNAKQHIKNHSIELYNEYIEQKAEKETIARFGRYDREDNGIDWD